VAAPLIAAPASDVTGGDLGTQRRSRVAFVALTSRRLGRNRSRMILRQWTGCPACSDRVVERLSLAVAHAVDLAGGYAKGWAPHRTGRTGSQTGTVKSLAKRSKHEAK